MTANDDHQTDSSSEHEHEHHCNAVGGETTSCCGRIEGPRENRGRRTHADELRTSDLKKALAAYQDAYIARGVGEATMMRALAEAYGIALERTHAVINDPENAVRGNQEKIFSWHFHSILGEFAVASHDSEKSLLNRGHDAHVVVTEFPDWLRAIEAGQVDLRHVRAMLKRLHLLDRVHYEEYGRQVLEYAATSTVRQTEDRAGQLVATIAAEAWEVTHRRARQERHVTIRHDEFGMATLSAYLPSEVAAPIGQLLDKQAQELRELDQSLAVEHLQSMRDARSAGSEAATSFDHDTRTKAQMRADILAETLLCATPGESRVNVLLSVTVPALSLLEEREDGSSPALLDGMRPMGFDEARQIASEAPSFQRVLTHPVTGQVTCVDTYQPDRALRRFLQVRDRTCRFPGCVRPATESELDHTTPYQVGGATSVRNLASLCKRHHVQKHEKPWTVMNHGGGVLEWRTPLGQVVTTSPIPVGPVGVQFKPTPGSRTDDPPPF